MLLIHLLLNSGSVKRTPSDSSLRLFRNYAIISFFQKLIKGGGSEQEREGGEIFQKLISGGDDYSVLESKQQLSVS